jgi:hypothetical protein
MGAYLTFTRRPGKTLTLDDETTFAIEDWLAARYGLA